MSDYHIGDIVDITIKGARVTEWDKANDNLTVEYETELGHYESGFAVDSEKFTVTHVASAGWPPQVGDLWRCSKGNLWFVREDGGEPTMTPTGYWEEEESPQHLARTAGPLTLVHREEAS